MCTRDVIGGAPASVPSLDPVTSHARNVRTRGHRGRCPSMFVEGFWRAGGLAGRNAPAAIEKTRLLEEKRMRPEGFEPPTLWFEARCSIQLS